MQLCEDNGFLYYDTDKDGVYIECLSCNKYANNKNKLKIYLNSDKFNLRYNVMTHCRSADHLTAIDTNQTLITQFITVQRISRQKRVDFDNETMAG